MSVSKILKWLRIEKLLFFEWAFPCYIKKCIIPTISRGSLPQTLTLIRGFVSCDTFNRGRATCAYLPKCGNVCSVLLSHSFWLSWLKNSSNIQPNCSACFHYCVQCCCRYVLYSMMSLRIGGECTVSGFLICSSSPQLFFTLLCLSVMVCGRAIVNSSKEDLTFSYGVSQGWFYFVCFIYSLIREGKGAESTEWGQDRDSL